MKALKNATQNAKKAHVLQRLIRLMLVGLVLCGVQGAMFVFAQERWQPALSASGELIGQKLVVGMGSAPFPHPARAQGHTYKGASYPAERHYRDSSVMIFLPTGFDERSAFDVVVYVHGWYNSIDSASAQFQLLEQFAASRVNAAFVFPEGPKFAPDSFGGKLEESQGLMRLLDDVVACLHRNNHGRLHVRNVVLAGHSGAYRAMAAMLEVGGVAVREVWLFDALYGQSEKFVRWMSGTCAHHGRDGVKGRCIAIYTNDGGTKEVTEGVIHELEAARIPLRRYEESQLIESPGFPQDLSPSGCVFIHTDLEHNEVIAKRRQLQAYLQTSCLSKLPAESRRSERK